MLINSKAKRITTIITLLWIQQILCSKVYPILTGGYGGSTQIEIFDFDASGNLAIAGYSSDTTLVGSSYAKIVFYLPVGSSSFSWVKTLSFDVTASDLVLRSMDFDETNNYIMLFYQEEPVFVFIDANNGDVKYYIRLEWLGFNQGSWNFFYCSRGCRANFVKPYNGKVQIFGQWCHSTSISEWWMMPWDDYRFYGIGQFNYQTMTASGTVPLLMLDGFYSTESDFYNCISRSTADFTALGIMNTYLLLVDTQTTSPIQIDQVVATNVLRHIDLLQSSSTSGFVFGCASDSDNYFNFFKMKVYVGSTSSSSDLLNKRISTSSGVDLDCSGLTAKDDDTTYMMVYRTQSGTTQMYLYQVTWTDPSCTYTAIAYLNGIDMNSISSRILSGPKWYFGGTQLWNFESSFSFANAFYTVGYIYSSDSSESYISLQSFTTDPADTPNAGLQIFLSKSISTSSKSTGIYSATLQGESNVGTQSNNGNCRIINQYTSPSTDSFTLFLGTTETFTLSFTPNAGLCPTAGCTFKVINYNALHPTITYTSSVSPFTSHTFTSTSTNVAFNGLTYQFEFRTYFNQNMYEPCYYAYDIFTVTTALPAIVPTTIPHIYYYLNSPAQINVYSGFGINPSTFTYYGIQYALYDTGGTLVTSSNYPFITMSYNTTHVTIQIYSTNGGDVGNNKGFYLRGQFTGGYFSVYSASAFIQVDIKICTTDTITASIISDQQYLVGESQLDSSITPFTALIGCETIVYSLTQISPSPASGSYDNPPIVAFDALNQIVSTYTTSYGKANVYHLRVTGAYTVLTTVTAYQEFDLYVIAPIITTAIGSIIYVVGDTTYNHVFSPFYQQQTTAGITFSYYLEKYSGLAADSIFSFNGQQLVSVSTSNNSKKGVYNLRVRAAFDSITLANSDVYSYFTVTVLDQCYRNQITSQPISDLYYNITDPTATISVANWVTTLSVCDPVTYTATYNGGSLPSFISLDSVNLDFTVYTTNRYNAGTYFIQVTGTTSYYNTTNSIISTTFTIQVGCTAKTIFPLQKGFTKYYYMGVSVPITVPISNFTLSPICNPETPIKYTSTLRGGQLLPSYIQFSPDDKKYVVGDCGEAEGKNLTVVLYATTDIGIQTSYDWYIKYVPFSFSIEGLKAISIPQVTLQIYANSAITYISTDFEQYTQNGYGVINPDGLNFLNILGTQVVISPKETNVGSYKFYLFAIDENNQRVIQTINVIVLPIQEEFTASQKGKLTAKIQTISKNGNVTVLFSELLKQIQTQNNTNNSNSLYSFINSTVLELSILDEDLKKKDTKFQWNITSLVSDQMLLTLDFDNPFEISQDGYDSLSITFLVNRYFIGQESQGVLKSHYTIMKKIPRQIGKDSFSQQIYDLTQEMQSAIDSIMNGNAILSFFMQAHRCYSQFRAYALNRLWGNISAVQILLILPLLSIDIPSNVELVYYFFNYNFQFSFLNFKFLDIHLFDNDNPTPYNDQFDTHDIFGISIIVITRSLKLIDYVIIQL